MSQQRHSLAYRLRCLLLLIGVAACAGYLASRTGRPWGIPADAFPIGDSYVKHDLCVPLERARAICPAVWDKCEREHRFVQGYGSAFESKGRHRHGWCLDIATGSITRWSWFAREVYPPLGQDDVIALDRSLESAGFAAPLRVEGYDLGGGVRVRGGAEHIHAVFRGHENYAACWRATRPGGRAALRKMLASR